MKKQVPNIQEDLVNTSSLSQVSNVMYQSIWNKALAVKKVLSSAAFINFIAKTLKGEKSKARWNYLQCQKNVLVSSTTGYYPEIILILR